MKQTSSVGSRHSASPQVRRILVPIDFSEYSKNALTFAVAIAEQFHSELILIYVVEPAIYPADLGFGQVALPNIERELTQRGKTELEQLIASQVKRTVSARSMIGNGKPFLEILAAAKKEDVDLIVIATHGHTGMEHLLFGSTAEKVVKKAHCPVLVVPLNRDPSSSPE